MLKTHSEKKLYKCSTCKKIFQQRQSLYRNKKSLCGVAKFSCSKCSKVLNRADSLRKHEAKCKGSKELKCKVCGKEFKYAWYTRRHIEQFHRVKSSVLCFLPRISYKIK